MQTAAVVAQEVLAGVVGTLPVGMNQGAVVVAAGMPTSSGVVGAWLHPSSRPQEAGLSGRRQTPSESSRSRRTRVLVIRLMGGKQWKNRATHFPLQ